MGYAVALEDDLYEAFHAFKHGKRHDTRLVEKLLRLYKPPHITNVEQLDRLGIDDTPLKSQLIQSGLLYQTVEELARKTIYKIVLSTGNRHFPYVNIDGDLLQNNYTMTCKPRETRVKALEHVKALLEEAKNVIVCDRYLNDNWETAKRIFDFFPKKDVSIELTYPLPQNKVTEIKRNFDQWKIKKDRGNVYRSHHDRYLLIDRQMEIVITSGMDYLFDDTKECTLVFRSRG